MLGDDVASALESAPVSLLRRAGSEASGEGTWAAARGSSSAAAASGCECGFHSFKSGGVGETAAAGEDELNRYTSREAIQPTRLGTRQRILFSGVYGCLSALASREARLRLKQEGVTCDHSVPHLRGGRP